MAERKPSVRVGVKAETMPAWAVGVSDSPAQQPQQPIIKRACFPSSIIAGNSFV